MFDVSKLTIEEVGAEIDKCLETLERLQALQLAMLQQDHRRITKLIEEYNAAKRQEKDKESHEQVPPQPQ